MNAPVKYDAKHNAQVIEHETEQVQQKGFRSHLSKIAKKAIVGGTAVAVSSYALALDVGAELAKTTAKDDIETGIIWALGIAVVIYAGRKVIGFFSR